VKEPSRSRAVTLTAVMAATALLISIMKVEFPFYPLVYLKFDFAEVPSALTYILAGPRWGYMCALVHYAGLLASRGDPLGPTMKFLAVASMLLGMQLARGRQRLSIVLGALVRVLAMSVANLLVVCVLFPSWLPIIRELLLAAGIGVGGWGDVLAAALLLTGVYNFLHTLLSVLPALLIVRELRSRLGWPTSPLQ